MAEQGTDRRPRVFCTWAFPDAGLAVLRAGCDVQVWPGEDPAPPHVIREELAEAEGLFAVPATDRLDAAVLSGAPRLRVIANFGVGYDNVDLPEATRRGILVCNTPGVLAETTADHAFALLLAIARRIAESDRFVRAGRWARFQPALMLGRDAHHATLGVVGLGATGTEMARRGRAFSMRLLYHSRTRRPEPERELGLQYVDLHTLLGESDFVSLHVPLTDATRGMIGRRELALMRPTSYLINTARGAIVDQSALAKALGEGRLAGAALDVFEREPLAPDDPLLRLENVVLVPHTGSATIETRARMAEVAATNIIAALQGRRPAHLVNPQAWRGS